MTTSKHHVRLLTGKARVTPLKGSTAPRSELSGLLILSRLHKVVVEALWEKPTSVTIAGDSQCTIAALEKSGGLLAPYFANRVSEIVRNLKEVSETVEVGDVLHLAGPLNPADLPTRETCSADDLNPDSEWMSGPAFLYKSRAEIPMSRKFLDQAYDLPPDELRPKKVTLLATKFAEGENKLQAMVFSVLEKTWFLQKAVRTTARLFKAVLTKDREKIKEQLTVEDMNLANQLIFFFSMEPTKAVLDRGDLTSLRVHYSKGIYYTQGRAGRALEKLLGITKLPVLMPGTRLAKLLMWESHDEDHRRTPSDALARSRERAWIVRGAKLAKYVTEHCPKCKLTQKKFAAQLMGDIPEHQLTPCPPFTNISVDFLGPYKVRGLGNHRARVKV